MGESGSGDRMLFPKVVVKWKELFGNELESRRGVFCRKL